MVRLGPLGEPPSQLASVDPGPEWPGQPCFWEPSLYNVDGPEPWQGHNAVGLVQEHHGHPLTPLCRLDRESVMGHRICADPGDDCELEIDRQRPLACLRGSLHPHGGAEAWPRMNGQLCLLCLITTDPSPKVPPRQGTTTSQTSTFRTSRRPKGRECDQNLCPSPIGREWILISLSWPVGSAVRFVPNL